MLVEFILILYINAGYGKTMSYERFINKDECERIGEASKELNYLVRYSCEPVLSLIKK